MRQTGGRLVPKKATKHSTAFITAPIALLAIAAVVVVVGSMIVGVHETDSISMTRPAGARLPPSLSSSKYSPIQTFLVTS